MRALVFKLLTALGLSILPGGAATLNASWNAPSDIPATAASYSATGNDINLTLNCIPAAAELTVIKNTGLAFIQGAFSNLSQGQAVALTFNAITYNFVANYYGGTGNDLVLVWSGARPFSWGGNRFGQLGDGTTTQRNAPVSVLQSGVLAGKTVFSIASGATHNLALCSDGTLAAWGYNAFGQLGDGTTVRRLTPVAVDQSGVLATKRVVAVAAGNAFSLALCSDGTVAAWGFNYDGELGDGTIFDSDLPVTVDTTTALAGKTVVAISAGDSHALALCSDGTVAAWGYNGEGRLGDDSAMDQWSPVAVATSTALSGKAVVSISAGSAHSLALCSDGTVVSWGTNEFGQVGDGSVIQRSVPVGVVAAQGTSALHGKTVTAIAAGGYHSLALCSDGTVAAWGFNANGQLGDNSAVDRLLPVAVKANAAPSALFGRRPDRVAAGLEHSIAWCSDGTVATWGRNANGQLGDASSIGRKVPVAAATATYAVGERPVLAGSGSSSEHSFSLAASFPAPVPVLAVEYPPGTGIPNGTGVADFGTVPVGGTFSTTFTVRNTGNATLTGFTITKTGANAAEFGVTITPISPLAPGRSSTFPVAITPLAEGPLAANLHIASNDPSNATYTIQLLAAGTITGAVNATFNAATDIPVTAAGYTAAGKEVEFTLNFAPEGGELMVVKNTGPAFISGTFSNLAQGQRVTLGFNGTTWDFVANYYGGSGNDLVLVRVGTRAYAWGYNGSGQLGNGTSTHASVPLPVMASGSGVLRGKTVVALAAGPNHSLALCSDGTVAAWGDNGQGMLGDNTTTASQIPVAVNREEGVSALFGKVVVALAAGSSHSLALCSDGTVAAWGGNSDGQLGDNTTATRTVPMAIDAATAASALLGKTVVGIAAGGSHSMALCSDGTLAAWGYNS